MSFDFMWDSLQKDFVWDYDKDDFRVLYNHDAIVQSLAIRVKYSRHTFNLINLNVNERYDEIYLLIKEVEEQESFIKVGSVTIKEISLREYALNCQSVSGENIEVRFNITLDGVDLS